MDRLKPENGSFDNVVRECFKKNKNSCISWFLSSSYCYYILYQSLMTDEAFDKMCKWMLENYDSLEHEHKSLVTKEMLSVGSGYNIPYDGYPLRVQNSASYFIEELYKSKGEKDEN